MRSTEKCMVSWTRGEGWEDSRVGIYFNMSGSRRGNTVFLNYGIVALQWCVSFCCTMKSISCVCVCVCVCVSPFPLGALLHLPTPSHPSRSPRNTKLRSPSYRTASHQPSVLHMLMHMHQSQSLHLSLLAECPHDCSLCLCLYSYLVNGFICTIFLESTYMR